MSRLDSFIRRMCAQRDVLNSFVPRLRDVDGVVMEFGLGGGRTLDHLRHCFPSRRIVVFERDVRENCLPDLAGAELFRGDIRDTAAGFPDGCAALVHADIDTGSTVRDRDLAAWLPVLAARLLVPGGLLASSIPARHEHLVEVPLPDTVSRDRYFLARRAP